MYFFNSKQDRSGIETAKPLCAILANLSVHFLCYVMLCYLFGYLFLYFYISLFFYVTVFIGKYILTYLLLFIVDIYSSKHKVRWSEEGHGFDGTPFIIAGAKLLDCQHGKDRQILSKQRKIASKNERKVTIAIIFSSK